MNWIAVKKRKPRHMQRVLLCGFIHGCMQYSVGYREGTIFVTDDHYLAVASKPGGLNQENYEKDELRSSPTPMQLAWAENVVRKTNGPVLIQP